MRALLLVISLLVTMPSLGQQGFHDGFLLSHSLDTLRGLVRFSGKASVPTPCIFKVDKKAPSQEIYPGTVHGFCTDNGAYYYTRSIGRSDDVFLEVLVKGHVSLFKFGDLYFIEKADSVFFELSDEMEVLMVEGQQQQQKSRNYTRMLALLMNDCPEASKRAPTVPLKEKHLVGLVQTYNRCKGADGQLFRVKGKTKYLAKGK